MTDLAQRIDRIESRLAIQDIVARYAQAVDARDLDALTGLFVDDIPLGDGGSGRAALADQLRPILQSFYRSVHQILGQVINLDGSDTASGTVYCRAEHECGDRWVAMAMCYFDKYVRRDDQWYFAGRQARSFYHADMATGPVPPYDVWPGRDGVHKRANLPQRWASWQSFWSEVPDDRIETLTSVPDRSGR